MDRDKLINYALLHLFEILQLDDKIKLLNSLYTENDIDDNFIERMKKYITSIYY